MVQMKRSVEEKVKSKLLKLGKKNRLYRILIVPVLAVSMLFFRVISYLKGNTKRLAVLGMTFLLFVVYSSFSFPMFIVNTDATDDLQSTLERYDDEAAHVVLATEEVINLEDMEILNDEDVLEEDEQQILSHGMEIVDTYDAEEILEFTREHADNSSTKENEISKTENIQFSKDDWRLILINKQHSIPEDYTFTLGTISGGMQCDERVIDDLRNMLQAAKEEEVSLVICSPYRDMDRQVMLFNRKINRYMNKGMSYMEAYQLSSQAVTVPGASEHQIGLALDIVTGTYTTLDEGFGETKAGKWLAENSYKYGFILRYPLGKEYITGIEYEPWHFRYVGVEAATIIMGEGITLEEFWEDYL